MLAVLSDIHGNLEALTAVLADARVHEATKFYNLGDIVGYGPDPEACIDLSITMDVVLRGFYDAWLFEDFPSGLSYIPEYMRALGGRLVANIRDKTVGFRRVDFLTSCPNIHRDGPNLFVHGTPRNPLREYVFPEDIYCPSKLNRIFPLIDHFCFAGNTHVPGVFIEEVPDDHYYFHTPVEVDWTYPLDGRKTLVNVGSVGRPHDGDPRACYVLFDGKTVTFRRVEYDVEATIAKMTDGPDFWGARLREGR